MKKNDLYQLDKQIFRVLEIEKDKILVVDCLKKTMPKWIVSQELDNFYAIKQEEFYLMIGFAPIGEEEIEKHQKSKMYHRYTIISPALCYIGDKHMRSEFLKRASEQYGVSEQSVKEYLWRYLAVQHIQALLPRIGKISKELTIDQQNMRWALNKYFYNTKKNSLKNAYRHLLKSKYSRVDGTLLEKYPSFNQFRYFYRKTRSLQNFYISRNGLSSYQRDRRPLLGESVQEYAPAVGVGMVDGTICDIYLVNEQGNLVGRPILVSCIDVFSGLCLGFFLGWEGGVYSLRELLLNIITDKVEFCKEFGINISPEEWPTKEGMMVGEIVSDQGSEYVGDTFSQITEIGTTLTNLAPYRPDLKGPVEKFFDIIQKLYKPLLKGKGVIEPDFQQRGAHDYRLDACIDLRTFMQIIIRCIIYYNSSQVLENYPFTEDMLAKKIRPYSSDIFLYGLEQVGANFIRCRKEDVVLTLLPRTGGKFSRKGLIVNKMRYKNDGKADQYLEGKKVVVAYNPDDITFIWLYEDGNYTRFELIERRYKGKTLEQTEQMRAEKKKIIEAESKAQLQAEIDLVAHIQTLTDNCRKTSKVSTKDIRGNRKKEQMKTHKSQIEEVKLNG